MKNSPLSALAAKIIGHSLANCKKKWPASGVPVVKEQQKEKDKGERDVYIPKRTGVAQSNDDGQPHIATQAPNTAHLDADRAIDVVEPVVDVANR